MELSYSFISDTIWTTYELLKKFNEQIFRQFDEDMIILLKEAERHKEMSLLVNLL